MSIDKTMKITDDAGSEIMSFLDNKLRTTISTYPSQFIALPKLTNSHSVKNLRDESNRYLDLEYQNEMLKAEISALKRQIRIEKQNRAQKVLEQEQEIQKLKRLIQKSYYSLKVLQKENISFKSEMLKSDQKEKKYQEKINSLQAKTTQMYEYIQQLKRNHEKEVKLIWQRVSHLQKNLQAVVLIIQEDRRDQKYHQAQLRTSRLKKQGSSISSKSFRLN